MFLNFKNSIIEQDIYNAVRNYDVINHKIISNNNYGQKIILVKKCSSVVYGKTVLTKSALPNQCW